MQQDYYLGIMSGTSLDGVDIALMAFGEKTQFIAAQFTPMPAEVRFTPRFIAINFARQQHIAATG